MPDPVQLDVLGPRGAFRAVTRRRVDDVTGSSVAELSLAPQVFVSRALSALRQASVPPAEECIAMLARAGHLFATSTLCGLSPADYQWLTCRVSGVPIAAVRRATHWIQSCAEHVERAVTDACPRALADNGARTGSELGIRRVTCVRRGDVLAVSAAANHPAVQSQWLEAVALGYRVAVRPSWQEPFTPHRLVAALRTAGFGADQVNLLPTDSEGVDALIHGADLAVVYGADLAGRYATDRTVATHGAGRSKVLLAGDDWRDHLDMVVHSVAHDGGTACVNATTVLVDGDPGPFAEALAARLAELPSLPPQDDRAVLPVRSLASAQVIEQYLLRHAQGARIWLGSDGVVDELGDGSAVLRPAVLQVDRAGAAEIGVELPFPCVWVAPWSRSDGAGPLRDTLVLTVVTDDEELIDRLVAEPSIGNVHIGSHPTCAMEAGIPPDGYLADFLMRGKVVLR
ncbi:aldehyde dehydrogenase family protein [Nocardia brevicatena]|uniref:aldehyde dehydrogenase family protein n=1 Tax=Nocardia brevicatena TaxID=37327 RepID=UPI000301E28F|nr:aldehyde dehydrogenase family protein [Nocardia brevicatena]